MLLVGVSSSAQTIMNIYQNNGTVLQIPLSSIDSITFTVNNPGSLASITTLTVGSIMETTAVSGGIITNDGGTPVTQRGVCWSTSPNPTTAVAQTSDGNGTGVYTSMLTGLVAGTNYYVRAYAINSAGTVYGNEVQFTTTGSSVVLATLTTMDAINITNNNAQSGGIITSEGGGSIYQRGVCWSTSGFPTIADNLTTDGGGIGSYTSNMTGLLEGATYYVRAYAINSAGTAYGNQIAFTTETDAYLNPNLNYNSLSDQNGNVYATIQIGAQVWMAENLGATTYANGDPIPNVTNSTQWTGLTTGAWSYYNVNSSYDNPYGKLYNWYAVADPRNVCPMGWHVPTDAEWTVLTTFLGGQSVAGDKMRSSGYQYWTFPNTGATNESGFSGLPGGMRNALGSSTGLNTRGYWWSSTELNAFTAFGRDLLYSNPNLYQDVPSKEQGNSVRCIMD